ncbi:MAG TPA: hypothetical protein VG125_28455 [Pirellulales bacterium]|jgi:hypothetical protein|nr:hypothetical protein [Pirellulales bacterium]
MTEPSFRRFRRVKPRRRWLQFSLSTGFFFVTAFCAVLSTLVVLGDTRVTDAGLAQLHGLTELLFLHLRGTKVTDDGAAQLKLSLPDCKIVGL